MSIYEMALRVDRPNIEPALSPYPSRGRGGVARADLYAYTELAFVHISLAVNSIFTAVIVDLFSPKKIILFYSILFYPLGRVKSV